MLKKRKEMYGDMEFFNRDLTWNSLYYQDFASALEQGRLPQSKPKDLRHEEAKLFSLVVGWDQHILSFDISPDNTKIVFLAAPSPKAEDRENSSLFILDITTNSCRPIIIPGPFDDC